MKCTATLVALVLATLSNAQIVGNPFFSCPTGTTGGCCLSFNGGGTGVNCGPVIPGPIPGHEKEFVCAFRPGEQKACCTTGGDTHNYYFWQEILDWIVMRVEVTDTFDV
ncbi:hypothetical protein BKA65DRAFT_475808 [Rhexocercosporidium sp. MPI-PUGE-AT-0058]|nr:hypothetical protein BKA65DRAFT_475808 [Rhexocercosporidium sp. MPI-PUGE-AT-0058]